MLNCRNSKARRNVGGHALYYALNLASLKSRQTRRVAATGGLSVSETIDFESEYEGAWQRLPAAVVDRLRRADADVILKFGMGLLRVPDALPCPILSYHHGDPRRFRGRPSGFYELLDGETRIGQIVQILSNRLDGGAVVAFAETRVLPHSYRATMEQAFAYSPLLIRKAIRGALSGETLPLEPTGTNYRLPSNATVARFAARLASAKLRRLLYGLFFEKGWQVAVSEASEGDPRQLLGNFPPRPEWRTVPRPRQYQFIADPFPHPDGGWLVEALRRSDGVGEIVHIDDGQARVLCGGSGHFSYPGTIDVDGRWYLVPENATWDHPRVFVLTATGAEPFAMLEVEGRPRIVDPTIHRAEDGLYYLFGSDPGAGGNILRLWVADSFLGPYREHCESPLRISPRGARMGGALVHSGGRLFRFGQSWTRGYGEGVVLFEVHALTSDSYRETEIGELRFEETKGPHTLNFAGKSVVFDFYDEIFSPLAGMRRLRSLVSRRNRARDPAAPVRPAPSAAMRPKSPDGRCHT